MRLVTTRKLYRAFPTLDGFSDDRCKLLFRYISNQSTYVIFVVVGAFLIWIAGTFGMVTLVTVFMNAEENLLRFPPMVGETIALIAIIALPMLAVVLFRDMILALHVRRVLTRSIDLTCCPNCRYHLVGQTVSEDNKIRCPECGHVTTLAALGLTSAEELRPESDQEVVLFSAVERAVHAPTERAMR